MRPTRTLASMTPDEITQYMQALAGATEIVTPSDAHFVLLIFGPDQQAHYVANCRRLEIPKVLRETADRLESRMAEGN